MLEVRDFYESLVDSSDDAIVAKDIDGIVVACNPAAERLFGWTAEEMIGQSIRRLLPPDRQGEEDAILARIRAGERVGLFATTRLHKDGSELDISVTISPVRNAHGEIVGAAKIARDAGPALRAQARLQESERKFRMLAENMSQFAWIGEADGGINWYNQRWYDYTGTTFEEMKGWGWRAVQHPDHVKQVEMSWTEAFESGEDWEHIFPIRRHDGEWRWFLSRAKPIRNDNGEIVCWFGTNTDITEQREQAEQIRLLLLEVNHRSKNMLSTIQSLARRSAPDEEGFLGRFENRVRSLAVNQDILVDSEWREVPVGELVRRQLDFLDRTRGRIDLKGEDLSLSPRAAEVIGMAIHELATNSLKYGALSAARGRVEIDWGPREDGSGLVFDWTEIDGPPVTAPSESGFGTTLIRDVPKHNLGAEVELDYRGDGLRWRLSADDRARSQPVQTAA